MQDLGKKQCKIELMNTRQKGRALEKYVAAALVSGGACTYAEPVDSGQGKDKREIRTDANISGKKINFECKNQKNISIKDWWKQADGASTLTDTVPAVCFSVHGTSHKLVTVSLEDFIELLKNQGHIELNETVTKALEQYYRKQEILKEQKLARKRSYAAAKKRKKMMEENPAILID